MGGVPFIGRLYLREYFALIGSFILIALEVVIRVITLALPGRILQFFYNQSRGLFKFLSSPASQRHRTKTKKLVDPIAQAADFVDLCALFGYYAEEHVVQTCDGYLLGLHRLACKKGEEDKRVNAGPGSLQKKVAYLHHGLMMNSEVWVCLSEQERCLPFQLVEKGYDVWLGNNRGNKYSKKSVHQSPSSTKFWDFSMDQFAFHDIPDTIKYILETTGQKSLSYIGFSQGTAQAFATLSIHPTLNDKVDVFVALAPAMSPPGLANGVVASLMKASPEVLFLAFGRKSILASSTMWQALLYPPIFVRFIDLSLSFLFGWKTLNITPHQKLAAYPHLYSFASTKCVVHWFQIINGGVFQMFDDEAQGPMAVGGGKRYYKVAKFPTRNIKTPIVLCWGGSDSLVNIDVMLRELPKHTVAKEIPHYEHLDFLWAKDVDTQVFPYVFKALEYHTSGEEMPNGEFHRRISRMGGPQSYSDDERADQNYDQHASITSAVNKSNHGVRMNEPSSSLRPDTPQSTRSVHFSDSSPFSTSSGHEADRSGGEGEEVNASLIGPLDHLQLQHKNRTSSITSMSSSASTDAKFGPKGIDLGAGRLVNGVSNLDGAEWHPGQTTQGQSKSRAKKKLGKE